MQHNEEVEEEQGQTVVPVPPPLSPIKSPERARQRYFHGKHNNINEQKNNNNNVVVAPADPRCLCISDLSSVPSTAISPSDCSFALESIRLNLATRSGGLHARVFHKEYVLFKSMRTPPFSRVMLANVRDRTESGNMQNSGRGMIPTSPPVGLNSSFSTSVTAPTLWSSVKQSFPLLGTISRATHSVSLIEAFCIARFGNVSRVGDVYMKICERYNIRDPNSNTNININTSTIIPPPESAISGEGVSSGVDVDEKSSIFTPPLSPNTTFDARWSAASGNFEQQQSEQSGGDFNSTNKSRRTSSPSKFHAKSKKKIPLSRLLQFLSREYDCHIIIPVATSTDMDSEDVIVHYSPNLTTTTTATTRRKQNKNQTQSNDETNNMMSSHYQQLQEMDNMMMRQQQQQENQSEVNNSDKQQQRIVILRPSGDLVIRKETEPNTTEEGVFVWSPNSSGLWQCAFLDNRPGGVGVAAANNAFPGPEKIHTHKKHRKHHHNKDRQYYSSDDGIHSPSYYSESDDEDSSSDSDDSSDDETSSTTSSDSDISTLTESSEDSSVDAHQSPQDQRKHPQKQQQQYTNVLDTQWTSQHPYRGKFVPSAFTDQEQLQLMNQQSQQQQFQQQQSQFQPMMDPNNFMNMNNNNMNSNMNMNNNNIIIMSPQRQFPQRQRSGVDIIKSDNPIDHDEISAEPPLANINYPRIDGSIGFGMLFSATIGSESPLFNRMRLRFKVILALCVIILIFCSGYLGAVNPNIDVCCLEVNFTQTNSTTSSLVLSYAQLFCPLRKLQYETFAATLALSEPTTTTTTILANTSLIINSSAALLGAQQVCSSDPTVRGGAITAAKFGDSAGGPVEVGSTFLFAAMGPGVTIFVTILILMILEVLLAFFLARRLAMKSQGIFVFVLFGFNCLLALFVLGEGAALVAHANVYKNDPDETMTTKVDCEQLPDAAARQTCHTGNDFGVELRTRIDLPGDTLLGLSAMLLLLGILLFVGSCVLYPFPSEDDERRILPSRPLTMIFSPGKAAPDGVPIQRVARLQHKIEHKIQHRMHEDVEHAKFVEEQKQHSRVYGANKARIDAPSVATIMKEQQQKQIQQQEKEQRQLQIEQRRASGAVTFVGEENDDGKQQKTTSKELLAAATDAVRSRRLSVGGGGPSSSLTKRGSISGVVPSSAATSPPRGKSSSGSSTTKGGIRVKPVRVFTSPQKTDYSDSGEEKQGQIPIKKQQQPVFEDEGNNYQQEQEQEQEQQPEELVEEQQYQPDAARIRTTTTSSTKKNKKNDNLSNDTQARIHSIAKRVLHDKKHGTSSSINPTAAAAAFPSDNLSSPPRNQQITTATFVPNSSINNNNNFNVSSSTTATAINNNNNNTTNTYDVVSTPKALYQPSQVSQTIEEIAGRLQRK